MVATTASRCGRRSDGLSVPFSSGQWLLPEKPPRRHYRVEAFSPLFVGAMVATVGAFLLGKVVGSFSPLFVGAMVATTPESVRDIIVAPFSPLFVGAMVATW